MGFFSDFFGGKKTNGVSAVADPYGDLRNKTTDWLTSQVGQPGKKYGGEMVAPMSEAENKSMSFLKDYGNYNLGTDQTFQNAKTEVNKTLTDQYDPTTSPYYQAVKAEAARGLSDTNEQIKSDAAGGGRYFSGARMEQQREAGTDVQNKMNTIMGDLAMQERQNKLGVIPQAMALSGKEQNQGLEKADAFQRYGSLPRTIQQAKDQSQLDDWLRSEYQYPMQIGAMASGVQQAPLYQQNNPTIGQSLGQGTGNVLESWLSGLMNKNKPATTPTTT